MPRRTDPTSYQFEERLESDIVVGKPGIQFNSMMKRLSFVSIAVASLVMGCGKTRYEIVAPPQARGEIAPHAGPVFSRDKIDYEIFQLEDKVVFHFVNRHDIPIELSPQTVLFDSTGHSFSVESQTVAPDQSGRVIVPPSNPISRGPTSPISAEVRIGGYDEGGMIPDDRGRYGGASMARDFRWPAGRTARFRFVFRVGEETITHEWTLSREKTK
jgi:hypothetical protein